MPAKNKTMESPESSAEYELEHLMRLSQQGDREAFSRLFELRRAQLVREVSRKMDRRLRPRVDASDVIQEVFMDANRRLSEMIENDTPLIAWLRFLCNQKLTDLQRKHIGAQKRSLQRERLPGRDSFDLDSIANFLVDNITSPSSGAHRNDLAGRVQDLLRELSPLDREILVLRHFHFMSNSEVAESLGLGINAASNRYVRALQRFKKLIDLNESDVVKKQSDES